MMIDTTIKRLIIIGLIILSQNSAAQVPISQVEGYLEVYLNSDTTSLYLGRGTGQLIDTTIRKWNTFIGQSAGQTVMLGSLNSFLGSEAGYSNSIGNENSFFGQIAGFKNRTGHNNSFFGRAAGHDNIVGENNSYFGRAAGVSNEIGDGNSFFGSSAGAEIEGSSNICLGNESGPPHDSNQVSNRLYIDVQQSTQPLIYGEFDNDIVTINGNFGIRDCAPGHTLSLGESLANTKLALYEDDTDPDNNYGMGVVPGAFRFNLNGSSARYAFFDAAGGGTNEVFTIRGDGVIYAPGIAAIGNYKTMQYNSTTGEIGYDNSSRRYKQNITTLKDDWARILQTRPVRYTRPASPDHWEYGYVAEEMDSIGLTNLVGYDAEGIPDDVKYDRMVIYLTELVKQHHQAIQDLRKENAALRNHFRSRWLTGDPQELRF